MTSQQRRVLVPLLALLSLLLGMLPVHTLHAAVTDGFADSAFERVWSRTDAPVATGGAGRSWTWGERAGERRYERYDQAPGAARLVQYFDKARMEVNDPAGDRSSPWFVTGGLLVLELIAGRIQVGATSFVNQAPASIPVAGDPFNNPNAPTYAMLAQVASIDGSNRAESRVGQRVSASFGPAGLAEQPALALPETQIARYEPVTGHNIPGVFLNFMQQSGPVLENGRLVRGQIVDPLFAFGYPISEPYWTRALVGGRELPVLFQAFERRVLTYNPANPDPWKVEMGNVGQHYLRWRHGRELRYTQAVPPQPISIREGSLSLPTYDLSAALRPSTPGDPIYPYERLDPARVGQLQPRQYRTVIVENRFLTLTFLPELGGRLLQVVDRSTGQPIFYQNPVLKPSPFGQRGWWLGVGGLEWAAPTEEHGYLENLPWELSSERRGELVIVRVTIRERQTGMLVSGIVSLRANESRFAVRMQVNNPTASAQPLQMWTNAMLSPGGQNRIGPGLQFVAPVQRMIVHATRDPGLPGPRELINWPQHAGRDLSLPANWNGYLGSFAPEPLAFLGVYDRIADSGALVAHTPQTIGAKIFGFGPSVERQLYTDDQSEYVELWSGAQATFWDYPPLEAGGTRVIESSWMPLHALGMLRAANAEAAFGSERRADGGLTVTLASAQMRSNIVVLIRLDGREVFRSTPISLRPDQPLSIELSPGLEGRIQLQAGEIVLAEP